MLTRIPGKIAMALVTLLPAAAAMAEEGAHAGEEHPGLLDPSVTSIIWVLAIFTVLAIILYRTAWKNVLQGLKAREDRIRNDIAQAESARTKAESTVKE